MPFSRLLRCKDARYPLAWWEQAFGRDFPAVRHFLVPCIGQRVSTYPCPDDPSVSFEVRESGSSYRAFPSEEWADDYDDIALEWSDVQGWRFDVSSFSAGLKSALKLKDSTAPGCHGLVYVGHCHSHGKPRHVYACLSASESEALSSIASLTENHHVGCMLLGSQSTAVSAVLQSRRIGSVALCECLSFNNGTLEGHCSESCSVHQPVTHADLSDQMREGFDSVLRERIEDIVDSRAKQETIVDMAEGPDKFMAGLRAQLSDAEGELFLLLIYREADDCGQLQLLSYAAIGERLGMSKQAAHARAAKLAKQHPQVGTFVAEVRKKNTPVPFSGMSPSERDKHGIDKSYNYDAG